MNKNKINKLLELKAKYKKCKRCELWKRRKQIVFGRGAFRKRILVVGEAPGPDEDKKGDPFIGLAGTALDEHGFDEIGLGRNDVFIMNAVLCYPGRKEGGGFNKPTEDQVFACRPRFKRVIEILKPRIIVAMGNTALFALKNKEGIMANREKYITYPVGKEKIEVVVTYHPSALNRDPSRKVFFKQDWHLVREHRDALTAF